MAYDFSTLAGLFGGGGGMSQQSSFSPFGMQDMQQWRRPMVTSYNRPSAEVSGGLDSLVSNYNQAYGQAKAANEARYQQMLDIANQTTQQRTADINSSYGQQSANSMQSLARLGMANTTVAPTMQTGIEREHQSALNRNADQMQQTKLGIIGSKTDAYPDLSSLQSIIAGVGSQYGQGQGLSTMLQALSGVRY